MERFEFWRPTVGLMLVVVTWIVGTAGCQVDAVGSGGSPPTPPTEVTVEETEARGPALRVATYNVNRSLAGSEAAEEAIRKTDADVVCLQETNTEWERQLREVFAGRYDHMEFRDCCLSGGLAILSKYEIRRSESIEPPEGGWFPAQRVVLEGPTGPVEVLNVHLRPSRAERGGVLVGMFRAPPIRRRQIRRYLKHLSSDLPTLVVGDFNESVQDNVLSILRDRGMRCTLCRAKPGATTWRWQTDLLGEITRRFDHVVYESRHFGFSEVEVMSAGRSDHLPVIADLYDRGRAD